VPQCVVAVQPDDSDGHPPDYPEAKYRAF
jgi:hypothetical protein